MNTQGLKGILGLQGSGLKNAGLQGSKTKMSGLQGSISSAFGLRAPLWSTTLRYKNYFATLNQVRKLKRQQFRPVFLNSRSRLSCLQLFKSGLNIKLE